VLIDVMRERRERGAPGTDLLGCLMRSQGDDDGARRPLLTDDQVADNIIGVLFAAQDTTASALTWAVKYLHDHPKLLEAVRAEQAAVREATGGGRRPLTWAHTRSMALTHRVRTFGVLILILSLFSSSQPTICIILMHPSSPVRPGDFGELKDGEHHLVHVQGGRGRRGVQRYARGTHAVGVGLRRRIEEAPPFFFNNSDSCSLYFLWHVVGFLIPKGWKVMPLFRNIHHSPDYFQDPHKFDPSRFQVRTHSVLYLRSPDILYIYI
jgi:hypothetical protein